jgi:hypothetical protein
VVPEVPGKTRNAEPAMTRKPTRTRNQPNSLLQGISPVSPHRPPAGLLLAVPHFATAAIQFPLDLPAKFQFGLQGISPVSPHRPPAGLLLAVPHFATAAIQFPLELLHRGHTFRIAQLHWTMTWWCSLPFRPWQEVALI